MTKKIMTLDELPTWSVAGPKSLKAHPVPEDIKDKLKFQPNHEINTKVSFWMRGDSASLAADAIVNAANEGLYAGGGICGVIHHAAGPELQEACKKVSPCPTGKAALTEGFKLPAKYVIHAVGPVGEKPELLKGAYESTLNYVDGEKIRSVGLCCISTGIFGYPIRPATHIALETVRTWLENEENRNKTDRIIFVVFESRDVKVYYQLAHEYFPLTNEEIEANPPDEADDELEEKKAERIEEKESEKEKGRKDDKKERKAMKKQEKKERKEEKKAKKEEKKQKKKEEKAAKKEGKVNNSSSSSSSSSSDSDSESDSDNSADREMKETKRLYQQEKEEERKEKEAEKEGEKKDEENKEEEKKE